MNTGYNPLERLGQTLGQTWRSVASYFGQAGNFLSQTPEVQAASNFLTANPAQQWNSPYVPQQNIPEYYQVKSTDKNLSDVSDRYGLPLQQVVDLNDGAKTLPPVGSYIRTNQLPSPPSGTSMPQAPGTTTAEGRGDPAAQRLREQAAQVSQQIATGQNLTSIPAAVVPFIKNAQGQPLSPQVLASMGFVYNPKTNSYEQPGAGGGGGGGGDEIVDPRLIMVRFGGGRRKGRKGRGFMTNLQWARNAWRRQRRGGERGAPGGAGAAVAPTETTRAAPETILDIHRASG